LSREGGWNASAREEQIRNSMFRNLKNGNYMATTGFFDYSPRFANELANNLLTIQNNGIYSRNIEWHIWYAAQGPLHELFNRNHYILFKRYPSIGELDFYPMLNLLWPSN